MTMSAFIDRLDDWVNPIVVKELRQAVKSRLVVVILMVFLVLMLAVMLFSLSFQEAGGDTLGSTWNAGSRVFAALQFILMPTLMLVVPAYAAIRMGGERSDNNVDLLFISTLSPGAIISGKFVASLMIAVMIFSIFAPFMTFTYLLRGIDLPTIGFILWIDVLAMLGSTIVALFLASVPGPRALKFAVNFGGFLGIFWIFCLLTAGTMEIISRPGFLSEKPEVIYTVMASVTVLVLTEALLLYFYAVALISPPSSNRILPVRLCLLGFWFATGAAMFWWAWNASWLGMSERLIPITLWVFFNMLNLCVQFLLSTCERDSWGPRMARTIPKNPVLRIPLFFLYTGSAGGVMFTLVLMTLTMLIGYAWLEAYAAVGVGGPRHDALEWCLKFWAAIGLYTICYALSAALVRHYFLRDQIRSAYTWVLAMLFVGVGSFIPSAVAYIIFFDQVRHSGETGWWLLANPFMAAIELTMHGPHMRGANETYLALMWWFLGTWFVLVVSLSLFWLAGQMKRFAPYERKAVPAALLPPLQAEVLSEPEVARSPVAMTAVSPGTIDPTSVTPG
jgi:ABC-type transport system involved in multi-copper enzyme maturation permease subunit